MNDLISRQATIDAMEGVDWYHIDKDGQLVHGANSKEDEPLYKASDVYAVLNKMPSAQPETHEERTETHACDLISRQAAIDALDNLDYMPGEWSVRGLSLCKDAIKALPPEQPEVLACGEGVLNAQPEWNNHTVACLLADLFDDTCACNYNGIDEWLPEKCEVIDSCPNPVGVACWEQFLKHRAERKTDDGE